MEQFCRTAVADEEIRLIAPRGSTVDIKSDFLNPRGIPIFIFFFASYCIIKTWPCVSVSGATQSDMRVYFGRVFFLRRVYKVLSLLFS